jgi:Domain of unknown function (DUF4188)
MTSIAGRRMRAEIDGDFVVFLIGARFDSKLHLYRSFLDFGGRRGLMHMLEYLMADPDKGLLGFQPLGLTTVVQYWRSFDHLEAFARNEDDPHLAVWRNYWKRVGRNDRSGIWHETYLVRAGEYEGIYGNMPPHGLGKASRLVPASDSSSARSRLRSTITRTP